MAAIMNKVYCLWSVILILFVQFYWNLVTDWSLQHNNTDKAFLCLAVFIDKIQMTISICHYWTFAMSEF